MNDFWQTFLIATIPSVLTALISFFAAFKNANTQIKAIREQNKADIEKLTEQNRVDIESLKEKHRLDMETKEKEYQHQMDIMKLQHEHELEKEQGTAINQLAFNALGGLVGGMFAPGGAISNKMNQVLEKSLEEQFADNENK